MAWNKKDQEVYRQDSEIQKFQGLTQYKLNSSSVFPINLNLVFPNKKGKKIRSCKKRNLVCHCTPASQDLGRKAENFKVILDYRKFGANLGYMRPWSGAESGGENAIRDLLNISVCFWFLF